MDLQPGPAGAVIKGPAPPDATRHGWLQRLWITLASFFSWFVLGACVLLWLPAMALLRLVTWRDASRYWPGFIFRKIGNVIGWVNPLWRFRLSGGHPADPRHPYVIVSNHQSFVDILLISNLPWEMKWLSKEELFRIPVLGWMMRMAGDIPVRRGERRSAAEALLQCRDRLAKKVSVVIFPEGTRSPDGELLPFKDGAFRLAVDAQLPILPLVLDGTGTALAKHDWRMGRSDAELRVLAPIDTTGMTHADVPRLRDEVRRRIARELERMRGQGAAA